MVSLKGFYRAGIDVFGIFSIYGSVFLSVLAAFYFVLGFLAELIVVIFFSISDLAPANIINPTVLFMASIFSKLFLLNIIGFIGLVYLVLNLNQIKKLLSGNYDATDKEKIWAILYMGFNVGIFLVYISFSLI